MCPQLTRNLARVETSYNSLDLSIFVLPITHRIDLYTDKFPGITIFNASIVIFAIELSPRY